MSGYRLLGRGKKTEKTRLIKYTGFYNHKFGINIIYITKL